MKEGGKKEVRLYCFSYCGTCGIFNQEETEIKTDLEERK